MNDAINVTISGAAGAICYSLIPMVMIEGWSTPVFKHCKNIILPQSAELEYVNLASSATYF